MAEGSRPGVVVDLAGIDRRLEVNADALELLFRGTREGQEQPLADAMAAARAAMAYANDAVVPDTVWAESIEPSPEGPVVFWDLTGTPEQNRSWLTAFTDEMVRGGWSGTLDPAPRPQSRGLYSFDATIRPAAYLAFRMNEEPPPGDVGDWGPPRWAVDTETTTALCQFLVDWAGLPGSAVHLTMGRHRVEFTGKDPTEHLVWAAEHDHTARVAYSKPTAIRNADLDAWGKVTAQISDHDQDWRTRVEHLRALLLQFADRLDIAFIRTGRYPVTSWINLSAAIPPLPHVSEAKVRLNRHLLDRYLIDAHGIQIMTTAHLNRLGPLPEWDVQPLAAGQYLVQARDLEPWFANNEPDPQVVAAARTDFTNALLTPEIIKTEN